MEKCLSNHQAMVDENKQEDNKENSTVKEGNNRESLISPELTPNKEQATSENDIRKPLAERVRPSLIDEMQVLFCKPLILYREMMSYSMLEVSFVICSNEIHRCLLFLQDPQDVVKPQ